jgi:hypothetical protein
MGVVENWGARHGAERDRMMRMDELSPAIVEAGATVLAARWDAVRPWVEALASSI